MTTSTPKTDMAEDIRDVAAKALNATDGMSGALFCDRIDVIVQAILAYDQRDRWMPIDSAPKDGTRIALWAGNFTTGHWDFDKYTKKPRPYWSTDKGMLLGKTFDRSNLPTHWMQLHAAPKGGA